MPSIQNIDPGGSIVVKNQVQLIAYVDRFGNGDLKSFSKLLTETLEGLFGCVHLLPFFRPIDGADTGFDPIDHTSVDERLGDWNDIKGITTHTDVIADLIVNHISTRSREFRDYLAKGDESEFSELFVSYDDVFPGGASGAELIAIYRPRLQLPFSAKTLGDQSKRLLWTTFTPEQVDIDIESRKGQEYLRDVMGKLCANGVKILRLDAVGYAVKRRGTSCFMLPETFGVIDAIAQEARALGMQVLVEVHSHFTTQLELARCVDWVYDFALPPLVLHTFFSGSTKALKQWFEICPRNSISVLDTHDGIGVIDIATSANDPKKESLLSHDELYRMVETIHHNSGGVSREATGQGKSNLDVYQINCTYYDAMGRIDHDYLLARLIQFLGPGIPQVYYVGLMAGENDVSAFGRTGSGREINRHRYTLDAIREQLEKSVVKTLMCMIRFRNSHPGFGGRFSLGDSNDQELVLRRAQAQHWIELRVDMTTKRFLLAFSSHDARVEIDSFDAFCEAIGID